MSLPVVEVPQFELQCSGCATTTCPVWDTDYGTLCSTCAYYTYLDDELRARRGDQSRPRRAGVLTPVRE